MREIAGEGSIVRNSGRDRVQGRGTPRHQRNAPSVRWSTRFSAPHAVQPEPRTWRGLLDRILDDPARFWRTLLMSVVLGGLLLAILAVGSHWVGATLGGTGLGTLIGLHARRGRLR